MSINLPVCLYVCLTGCETDTWSGYSRTEQTVTESVSGCLCCSWLLQLGAHSGFYNIKQLCLAESTHSTSLGTHTQ